MMARKKRVIKKIPVHENDVHLDDDSMRRLLQRLEQCPPEVIRMVLLYLKNDRPTLKVLKYAGPTVRAQVMPILHWRLTLVPEGDVDERLMEARTLLFHHHVQHLSIPLTTTYHSYPPRLQYFLTLEVTSMFHNLRSVKIGYLSLCDEAVVSMLDILSSLPHITDVKLWGFSSASSQEPGTADKASSPAVLTYVERSDGLEIPFPRLKRLSLMNMALNPMIWLSKRLGQSTGDPDRSARLHSLYIGAYTSPCNFSTLIEIFASQASTLRTIQVNGTVEMKQAASTGNRNIRLPNLLQLSCAEDSEYEIRTTVAPSASLLLEIEAPSLLTLGCGHILDGHPTDIVRRLANHWLEAFPKLERILTRHLRPPPHDAPWADEARNALLRTNIEVLEQIFEGRKVKIYCLEEEIYDDYLKDHVPI